MFYNKILKSDLILFKFKFTSLINVLLIIFYLRIGLYKRKFTLKGFVETQTPSL